MIGVDIIEIARFEKLQENSRFFERIFTTNELTYLDSKGVQRAQCAAALFAAKEAVVKAMGTGFSKGITPKCIEIAHDDNGAPFINLYGKAKEYFEKLVNHKNIKQVSNSDSSCGGAYNTINNNSSCDSSCGGACNTINNTISITISHCDEYAVAICSIFDNVVPSAPLLPLYLTKEIEGFSIFSLNDIKKLFMPRLANTHKGDYGKLNIIAGSSKYFGAACISHNAAAALRSGCGLTVLTVPQFLKESYYARITEATLNFLPSDSNHSIFDKLTLDKIMHESDAICIGMGMGNNVETFKITEYLIKNYSKKLLLDADALNAISVYNPNIFDTIFSCEIIITPHLKEFERLTNIKMTSLKAHSYKYAIEYAKKNKVTVLLKGYNTIITDGTKKYINTMTTPALAKGGTGDVLSGIIGALLAKGFDTLTSGACGAALHGNAAKIAEDKLNEHSVLATDIVNALPIALNLILKN